MMRRHIPGIAVLLAVALGGQAQAQALNGHSKAGFLRTYDTDLDGKVSTEEYAAKRREDFGRTDADGGGTLSQDEYVAEYAVRLDAELAALRQRQLDQARVRFGVMDADKDGRMTPAEYEATARRTFSRLDTNGDRIIDEADTAENH